MILRSYAVWSITVVAAAVLTATAGSTPPGPQNQKKSDILINNVRAVVFHAAVLDNKDRIVDGLPPSAFHVFQDGTERRLLIAGQEDSAARVTLVVDNSRSIANANAAIHVAAVNFAMAANPKDEFAVVSFDDQPKAVGEFTSEIADFEKQLPLEAPHGASALWDALYAAVSESSGSSDKSGVVVAFTDGGDNNSRHSADDVRVLLQKTNVQLYAMMISDEDHRTFALRHGQQLLANLCEATGGHASIVENTRKLSALVAQLSDEIRRRYTLGYLSDSHDADGRWKKIQVKLDPQPRTGKLKVIAQPGYYAVASQPQPTTNPAIH
jgi:Ca-activated chloride channel family protein